ncbi:MAG: DUF5110 domain-containing protein [Candidatus Eisenbacteria sp.]|nr:DUF5110 domain-containing protein [Candidatus Eisenbacteria bacterium]
MRTMRSVRESAVTWFTTCRSLALLLAAVLATAIPPPTAAGDAVARVGERCGDRIARFHASEDARARGLPSIALAAPLPDLGPVPAGSPVQPTFFEIAGRPAVRIDIEAGTSLYGTGETTGPLLRNGTQVIAWNYDAYGYGPGMPHLYQSHPWVLAVRADGSAYGILAETSYRCRIDLAEYVLFAAEGPPFSVLIIERDSPQEVITTLADLIGRIPLPPQWALGYHQCRYSYCPEARVLEIARGFRDRAIPCDVIWLDIDYMDGFRSFTFHPEHFPDPRRLTDQLHAWGFKVVAMIDPGIKRDPEYFAYDSGSRADAWVKAAGDRDYIGTVWPGECVFPDFTNADARAWWAGLHPKFLANGIDGVWNDMNEPAIFNAEGRTMPLDNVHRADRELGGIGPHARYHNVYGMQMVRATQAGLLQARPDRRPFVLTRANFIGGHRYAAAWTGDNVAVWEHLEGSIPMILNLGLSGQPFAGADIGGFSRAGTGALFARWMGIGALMPFARGHTEKGNIDKEPWSFGQEIERTCRQAIQRRYRLMPYLYTLFREAAETGVPVMRPLFFADPSDPKLRAEDDAFLLGGDVLVIARPLPNSDFSTVRPAGIWRRFDLGLGDGANLELPRIFLRGGAILPAGPVSEYAGQVLLDPLTLYICLDEHGLAEGLLYEDAGEGFDYREGAFRLARYRARQEGETLVLTRERVTGNWPTVDREVVVHLLTLRGMVTGRGRSGATLRIPLAAAD